MVLHLTQSKVADVSFLLLAMARSFTYSFDIFEYEAVLSETMLRRASDVIKAFWGGAGMRARLELTSYCTSAVDEPVRIIILPRPFVLGPRVCT